MKRRNVNSIVLMSLLATSMSASARSISNILTEKEIEAVVFVLSNPVDREELRYLLDLRNTEGLEEAEITRLRELMEKSLNKLKSAAQPMLTSGY